MKYYYKPTGHVVEGKEGLDRAFFLPIHEVPKPVEKPDDSAAEKPAAKRRGRPKKAGA